MSLTLITAPSVEPVTLAEAKLQCKVEHSTDDALITGLIQAFRERAEHELGRALLNQTWELALDAFPEAEIELPKPAVSAIVSVTYIDTNGATQTVSAGNYSLDAATSPAWVLPALNYTWPSTQDVANAVKVRFTTGYGATAATVPEAIKTWIRMQIAAAYANREAVVRGTVSEIPNRFVDGLLDPFRTYL